MLQPLAQSLEPQLDLQKSDVLRTYTRTCELLPTDLADTVWGLRQDGQKDDLEKTWNGTNYKWGSGRVGDATNVQRRQMYSEAHYTRRAPNTWGCH